MLDVLPALDLVSGIEYVGCSRSELCMPGGVKSYFRVTFGPSFGGYINNARFSDTLREIVGGIGGASADAFAATDFAPAAVDNEYGYTVTASLDFVTLGNARTLHVVDLVTKLEANFSVRVLRVERVAGTAVQGDGRFPARDDAAASTSPNPFAAALGTVDKLVLVVVLLAVVAGLGYILPRR